MRLHGATTDGLQRRDIVAERFAEAAGLHEIALHVDDEQCGRFEAERELIRLGSDGFLRHVFSRLMGFRNGPRRIGRIVAGWSRRNGQKRGVTLARNPLVHVVGGTGFEPVTPAV